MNLRDCTEYSNTVRKHSESGSEKKLENVLAKLVFISKLKVGEKFNTKTFEVREPGYVTSIARTLNTEENRWESYEFIKKVINEAINLFYLYNSSTQEYYKTLSKEIYDCIVKSKIGIDNQIKTYYSNRQLTSKFTTLIKMIDAKINL